MTTDCAVVDCAALQLGVQLLINGLAVGTIYAALGLALVVIYRSTGIVNFAQGEMATLAAYLTWMLAPAPGDRLPFWVALTIAVAISFALGVLIYRYVVRPADPGVLTTAAEMRIIVVTIGVFLILGGIIQGSWGPDPHIVADPFGGGSFEIGPFFFPKGHVGTFAILIAMLLAAWLVFQRSRVGLAMRATVSNRTAARLAGVDVDRMLMLGWGIAAAVGAVGGATASFLLALYPGVMTPILIMAFAAIAFGGLTSPAGAIVGGLSVGAATSMAGLIPFIGNELKTALVLVLLIAVLIFRPTGLFGRASGVRV